MNQSNLKKLQNLLKEKDFDIFVINRSDAGSKYRLAI